MTETNDAGENARTKTNDVPSEKDGGYGDLTATQRDILHILPRLEEANGRDVQRALAAYRGHEVNHPTVYTNLNQLVETGLAEKASVNGRTNAYTLSDEGRRALRARRSWTETDAVEGEEGGVSA